MKLADVESLVCQLLVFPPAFRGGLIEADPR